LNSTLVTLAQRRYVYEYAERKIDDFMLWLEELEKQGVLETVVGPGIGAMPIGEVPWTNTYIQSAYQKGIANARADLIRDGAEIPQFDILPGQNQISAVFNSPFHANRVGLIYTRAFNGMKGITSQMNTQISHYLAKGMAEGRHPREIARNINDRIDKIGITRGRLIARTEVIHAHNNATLNEYERIENFTEEVILTRWFTARDERVRDEHKERHNRVYTRQEAEFLIGDPNCRCSLLPYIPSIHGVPAKATAEAMRIAKREAKKAGLLKEK